MISSFSAQRIYSVAHVNWKSPGRGFTKYKMHSQRLYWLCCFEVNVGEVFVHCKQKEGRTWRQYCFPVDIKMKCFYNYCAQSCVDCSQSPIFLCDRRCGCGSLNANETEESTFCYLASRDQDDSPVELNDRHLRSHGKIGDCEQSKSCVFYAWILFLSIYNQSIPIYWSIGIDNRYQSITTQIFTIDWPSIVNINRLIDIDWYWLISIVVNYRCYRLDTPGCKQAVLSTWPWNVTWVSTGERHSSLFRTRFEFTGINWS